MKTKSKRLELSDQHKRLPTSASVRVLFERCINDTPTLAKNLDLTPSIVNPDSPAKFGEYNDPATDFVFVGFGLGLRMAKRAFDNGEIVKALNR